MHILGKARTAVRILQKDGLQETISVFISQYGRFIPLSAEAKRKAGIRAELRFWDAYFKKRGFPRAEKTGAKFDADYPLQPRPAALLPERKEIQILDVGSGPLTTLGKKCPGKQIYITAVDPLADGYNRILDKYQIEPLVRTQNLAAEDLTTKFPSNTFDLVFARNCIDHANNPERAILQMVAVVKNNGYVLLEHYPNEAKNENYQGLHQWNFSMSANGDFLINSRSNELNVTKKYAERCTITCEIVKEAVGDGEMEWLITRIKKK